MPRVDFDAIYKSKRALGQYGWHELPLYEERVAVAQAFLARNEAKVGDKVLFLGCGSGHTLLTIARTRVCVSGIDISQEAISWARDNVAAAGLIADLSVGDVVTLDPYPDSTFQFIIDDYCLQCVIGAERAVCFLNIFRILIPGGAFLAGADCTSAQHSADSQDPEFEGQTRCLYRDGVPYAYLTFEGELEEEITRAGFSVRRSARHQRHQGRTYHAGRQWLDAVKPR